MSRSNTMSEEFYGHIGATGLAARTTTTWDKQLLASLRKHMQKNERVLDVGCGYGRITIPLARAGYTIEGIDLSQSLIHDARASAKRARVSVSFTVGNMCALPYGANSFDGIICLWSAFNELLTVSEQLRAIRSMKRVLAPGGWALLEGALYTKPTREELRSGAYYGRYHRIRKNSIAGVRNDHYNHDVRSLRVLMHRVGITNYSVFVGPWAGRKRLFLRFQK